MPDLPTLTVTTSQAQRILDSFSGHYGPDGTPLTQAQAYKLWLKQRLRDYVMAQQSRILDEQLEQSKISSLAAAQSDLDQL